MVTKRKVSVKVGVAFFLCFCSLQHKTCASSSDHQVDEPGDIPYADLPPLIPEPVEHMHFTPSVSITPAPTILQTSKAVRPNQLDLEGPVRPARHLKPPTTIVETPLRRPVSPG